MFAQTTRLTAVGINCIRKIGPARHVLRGPFAALAMIPSRAGSTEGARSSRFGPGLRESSRVRSRLGQGTALVESRPRADSPARPHLGAW